MALIDEHANAAGPPLDDYQKESLQRVHDLLAKGCVRHGLAADTLGARFDRHHGVQVFGTTPEAQQTAFALGALVGAGYEYNELRLIAHARANTDGSLSFYGMHDAMLCAYAFGTPMAERQHSAAVRKETPATGPRTRS